MQKILVSACLLGEKVRYDGLVIPVSKILIRAFEQTAVMIPFCPEVSGGLPVPREPSEISGNDGYDVLDGKAAVKNTSGNDVTIFYLKGAAKALESAVKNNIMTAILKEKSPSCGKRFIYNGGFEGMLKEGKGVTAALFERNGIHIFSEKEIAKAARFIKERNKEYGNRR
jgi:uncharacterized protein YbbK (DUF523 family)